MFSPDRLREKRKERGLSREELADMVGVSFVSIRFYEEGKRLPSVPILERLARALRVKIDALFNGNQKQKGGEQ